MVCQFDGIFLHNAVEYLDFSLSLHIKNEAVVDGSGFAVRSFSAALCRISVSRAADVMAIVVVAIDCGCLVARNIAFLEELLNRDGVFFTVHVSHDKDRDGSEFSLYDLSLSKNQPDL